MAADDKTREAEANAYRDGYRAGYGKGIEDGAASGYSDAKLRSWLAYDVLVASQQIAKTTLENVATVLSGLVGKR